MSDHFARPLNMITHFGGFQLCGQQGYVDSSAFFFNLGVVARVMKSKLKIKNSLLLIFCGGLTLFSCNFSDHNVSPKRSNAAQLSTGLLGEVLRGPNHTGPPQAGDNAFVGFASLFYVYDDHGTMVTTFTSDTFGWFKVGLDPGHYTIAPDDSAPLLATGQTQQATVVAGKFSSVTLRFDSSQ